ncbi:DUF3244 domain-containing protein [Parabacteroides sp.]
MYRLFLIAVLLCITISGFANRRKIYLDDRARFPMPPIEVFVDDRLLEMNIQENIGMINVFIKDTYGNVVFNTSVEGKVGSIPMELELKKGTYIIFIDCQNDRLCGSFSIE